MGAGTEGVASQRTVRVEQQREQERVEYGSGAATVAGFAMVRQ